MLQCSAVDPLLGILSCERVSAPGPLREVGNLDVVSEVARRSCCLIQGVCTDGLSPMARGCSPLCRWFGWEQVLLSGIPCTATDERVSPPDGEGVVPTGL